MINRKETRQIKVGAVPVGGGAPVSVQTMTKTDTRDIDATVSQIKSVAALGCDIVRIAVIDNDAALALKDICDESPIPVIADIHFDYRLALTSLESGVDGLRINPGNIGGEANVREVVAASKDRLVPIRIGVNAGSLEKDIHERLGASPAALVESALRHVKLLEDCGYHEIKISAKASDVNRTVETYRLLSEAVDYPLHLGVTEAGTLLGGTIKSAAAMGILISEGIGDTIRVSLTDTPEREVQVGLEILRSLGIRKPGPSITSCPTCGRVEVDVVDIAARVEVEMQRLYLCDATRNFPHVAVMGCMVNGPGEAREADIALAGGKNKFALYVKGAHLKSVTEAEAVSSLMDEVKKYLSNH